MNLLADVLLLVSESFESSGHATLLHLQYLRTKGDVGDDHNHKIGGTDVTSRWGFLWFAFSG
jgi:acyl-CoA-binding protein